MHFREGFTANDREGQGIAAGQDSFSRRSSGRSRFYTSSRLLLSNRDIDRGIVGSRVRSLSSIARSSPSGSRSRPVATLETGAVKIAAGKEIDLVDLEPPASIDKGS